MRRSYPARIERLAGKMRSTNISTGVYGYPKDKAAAIVHQAMTAFATSGTATTLKCVTFVCFDDENYQLYQEIFDQAA